MASRGRRRLRDKLSPQPASNECCWAVARSKNGASPPRRTGTGAGAVIVNWNTPSLTLRCVESLLAEGLQPHQIVIVDNGSTDDSTEQFTRGRPDVRVLRSSNNLGFARASNAGAAELEGAQTLLFVNSDAAVHRPGSIAALERALLRPGVGIAVPRLLNEDLTLQRSVVPFRTPWPAFLQTTRLDLLVPNSKQPRWGMYWDHGDSREVWSVTGAVLAVRRKTWAALGGFHEGAHLFAEDHDLCWRAHRIGWKTWFEGDAEFVHTGGASTSIVFCSASRAHAVARAEAALVRRQLGPFRAALTLRLFQLGFALRWAWSEARGDSVRAGELAASIDGLSARAGEEV